MNYWRLNKGDFDQSQQNCHGNLFGFFLWQQNVRLPSHSFSILLL